MSNSVSFSLGDSLRKLEKELEGVADSLAGQANQAIADLAAAAYARIVSKAQAELNSTRPDFLRGLRFERLGSNEYLISLEGEWPNKLEDGYPSYNLTDVLMKSQKIVQVGSRAGQPWVQHNKKDGAKFGHVPFEKNPNSKAPKNADVASAIQEMRAKNAKGRQQKITSIFKDGDGNPIEGFAARGSSDNPLVDNLVKYQKVYENEWTKKKTVQSVYIAYRTVSEKGKPWINPGFSGLGAFPDAEKYLEEQIDRIAQTLFGEE